MRRPLGDILQVENPAHVLGPRRDDAQDSI